MGLRAAMNGQVIFFSFVHPSMAFTIRDGAGVRGEVGAEAEVAVGAWVSIVTASATPQSRYVITTANSRQSGVDQRGLCDGAGGTVFEDRRWRTRA
jgi:hypothetical protein